MEDTAFVWISQDPKTLTIVPYSRFNSKRLEYGFRNQMKDMKLMIKTEHDALYQATVDYGTMKQTLGFGHGERNVFRTESDTIVIADDIVAKIDPSWKTHFDRVAWVHLNPVSGEIEFYSVENSTKIEQAYRNQNAYVRLEIFLPSGHCLSILVDLTKMGNSIFSQSTNQGGFREVRRLVLENDDDNCSIDIFMNPTDRSHGIDAGRYRFSKTSILQRTVSISMDPTKFMLEESLPQESFASLDHIDNALRQSTIMDNIPKMIFMKNNIKEDAFLKAVKAVGEIFDFKPDLELIVHNINEVWTKEGFIVDMCPTDKLFNNLSEVKDLFDYNDFRSIRYALFLILMVPLYVLYF